MSLSVIANRSHSGFRAAVYGIHFDPWDFDTLLYFVKMVAFFALHGCREFAFFVYAKELPAEDCPTLTFFLLRGFHSPPLARPFSKGLLASDYLTFTFAPLRGSILRLRRGPSPRAYSPGIISHGLSYRRRLTIFFSQSLRRCAGVLLRGRS